MKIVNRKEFLAMPNGTVYQKYQPCIVRDFGIKEDTWDNDFIYQDLEQAIKCSGSDNLIDILDKAENEGVSFDVDFDCNSRDGLFDDDQLFAVWEDKDVEALVSRLINRKHWDG